MAYTLLLYNLGSPYPKNYMIELDVKPRGHNVAFAKTHYRKEENWVVQLSHGTLQKINKNEYCPKYQREVKRLIKKLQLGAQEALQSYRYCRPTRLPVKDQTLDPAPQYLIVNLK